MNNFCTLLFVFLSDSYMIMPNEPVSEKYSQFISDKPLAAELYISDDKMRKSLNVFEIMKQCPEFGRITLIDNQGGYIDHYSEQKFD